MDERQQQVKIGSGLEESRINREFIDFLNKWGPRVLIVILVVVVAYQGNRLLVQRANSARDTAYTGLYERISLNNPTVVLEYGDEHDDQKGIWEYAYVNGGMMLLTEGTRGVSLEAQSTFNPKPEEILTKEQRTQRYTSASEVFGKVIDRVENDPVKRLILIQALSGKASAELSLGNFDEARGLLERIVEIGKADGFEDLALLAEERLEFFEDLKNPPKIVASADLPTPPISNTGFDPSTLNFQEDAGRIIRADEKPEREVEGPNVDVTTIPAEGDDDGAEPGDGEEPDETPATDPAPGG